MSKTLFHFTHPPRRTNTEMTIWQRQTPTRYSVPLRIWSTCLISTTGNRRQKYLRNPWEFSTHPGGFNIEIWKWWLSSKFRDAFHIYYSTCLSVCSAKKTCANSLHDMRKRFFGSDIKRSGCETKTNMVKYMYIIWLKYVYEIQNFDTWLFTCQIFVPYVWGFPHRTLVTRHTGAWVFQLCAVHLAGRCRKGPGHRRTKTHQWRHVSKCDGKYPPVN